MVQTSALLSSWDTTSSFHEACSFTGNDKPFNLSSSCRVNYSNRVFLFICGSLLLDMHSVYNGVSDTYKREALQLLRIWGYLCTWSCSSLQIIHTFFKSRLTFLTSDTVDGPTSTEKCIRLRHQSGNQGGGNRFQKRGRDHGGRGRGRGRDRDSKRHKLNEGDLDQPYDARGSDGWPSERPKFLQCVPYTFTSILEFCNAFPWRVDRCLHVMLLTNWS